MPFRPRTTNGVLKSVENRWTIFANRHEVFPALTVLELTSAAKRGGATLVESRTNASDFDRDPAADVDQFDLSLRPMGDSSPIPSVH